MKVIRAIILPWESSRWSLVLALVIYSILAMQNGLPWSSSPFPYYNYLADAFLNGQTHLRVIPAESHDLVFFNHKYYLYWPPMPALILMPFIAAFGIKFSDIIFTLGVAAINVSLVSLLLRDTSRKGLIPISRLQIALLVMFFALGTVHITLAPFGQVWFTGQLIGFLMVLLAYISSIRFKGWLAFFVTGLFLTFAMLTRNHLLFAGIWPAYYLLSRNKGINPRQLIGYASVGILPVVLGLISLGYYNWVRFGNVLDVGLDYHEMASIFVDEYKIFRVFNIHYLPTNVYYQYFSYPFPMRGDSFMGGSLFLLSPVFVAVFSGLKAGFPRWSKIALVVTIFTMNIPILMLMGTGWVQFGPRYTLDFTVPLLLLTALGVRNWPNSILVLLTAISIVHYISGTLLLMGI